MTRETRDRGFVDSRGHTEAPSGIPVPAVDPGIEITVADLKTGDVQTTTIVDDVLVITAGNHYVHYVQKYANGTTIWTIKTTKGHTQ